LGTTAIEVLAAVKMMFFFWVVTPYGLVGRYQRFREIYCLQALKMKTVYFSGRLVSTYKSTRRLSSQQITSGIMILPMLAVGCDSM
jgi:hypothetical protein